MKRKVRKYIRSAILILLIIWIVWGNVTVGITHYTVVSPRLPAALDHFTIAVISDLHNARFGQDNRSLIALIEREAPDMIAITGDLIDSGKTDIETAEKLVQRLVEIAPCYYVTGNHEAWSGEQYQELEGKLLDVGAVILHDRAELLTRNNGTVQIIGLDDPDFPGRGSSFQDSIGNARSGAGDPAADYCILLAHRPENFSAYVAGGIDLVLSGHAHGGQFRLPFIGGLIAPGQGLFPKYDAGEYTEGNTTMIVSRGIGNSVVPVRFNNRPEIVIVELISE